MSGRLMAGADRCVQGIGPATILERNDVQVKVDSPSIGQKCVYFTRKLSAQLTSINLSLQYHTYYSVIVRS